MNKLRFPRLIQRLYNLSLRNKLLLSYAVVGIIPFLVFSVYLILQTNQQLTDNARQNFTAVVSASRTNAEQQIEKIEDAMHVICTDSGIADIVTAEYNSYYDKYFDVTKHFDSVIQTIMLSTPQVGKITFYVPNNLADVRTNILPLENLTQRPSYTQIKNATSLLWTYEKGQFVVYQKIYNSSDIDVFCVVEAHIPYSAVFVPEIFDRLTYEISLYDTPVHRSNISEKSLKILPGKAPLFHGNGQMTIFMDSHYETQIQGSSLIVVILGSVLTFILLLFAITVFSKNFVSRIDNINRQLSVTVKNNFETTIQEDCSDEIGNMTVYINQMIRDTQKLIRDVYQSKIKQREYEIQALQAQLNPHFLYNTLSAINWHALTVKNEKISQIVMALSRFYRTALNDGKSMTTIRNEWDNIHAYLEIELNIHGHSFDVEYIADESIMEYCMPNLIIQPIVENAIEHGIDLKKDGRGKLIIEAVDAGDIIVFHVIDNGVGISSDKMKNLMTRKTKGYGMYNVNKRLELFFGAEYELTFTSGEGTTATIRIPKQRDTGNG